MNESELAAKLQKDYPELSAQVIQLGVNEGVRQERARIVALLPKHPIHPAAKLACEFIRNGKEFNNSLVTAKYLCLKMKAQQQAQQQARDSENVVSMLEFKAGVTHDENDNH